MLHQIKALLNNTSWIVNLIFLLLAIGSIMITIITYFKSKKRKTASFRKSNFRLISKTISSIPGLKITMNKKPIDSLSLTYISIWNNGNDLINFQDIAPKDPLRIRAIDEFKIFLFDIDFIKNTNNNINLTLSDDRKEIVINFDYFGRYDGLVVKVYHDGLKSSDILISGTIKGFGTLKNTKNFDIKSTYVLWDFLFGKLKKYYQTRNKPQWMFNLIIFLALFTFPVTIPLLIFDKIRSYLNIIPKEYKL